MKKLLPLVLLLVLALCACGGSDADSAEAELLSGTHHAEIEVQDYDRIMDGFMIQGGQGGAAQSIKGEFEANGVPNDISHVRGVISMARAQAPDSGSSQFFIVHQDSPFLDGQYAAFGHVTDGMDVVDAIERDVAPKALDDNGAIAPDDQPVITTIRVID